ncbi:MAG TPA: carbohydrate kinase family protein [bacterium]|nr:carbohydrate kinase family protein [bacterium]HNS48470.1 carbohydrate kinase family protein [bacterium]
MSPTRVAERRRKRAGICCGGNWLLDFVKIIDAYPAEERLANILEESVGNGGAPYNVLVDLARIDPDLPLEGVGVIGRDENSRRIMADIRRYRIRPVGIFRTDRLPTAYTDVMTDRKTGRRTFFHNRGANRLLGPEHFDFKRIRAEILHVGYALLLDGLDASDPRHGTGMARVFHSARAAGLKTSLDVVSDQDRARFRQVVSPALPEVDYLILNEFEAGALSGLELDPKRPREGFAAAARRLFDAGVRELVIIHMAVGAWLFSRKGEAFFQPAHQLPAGFIRSTVGAGDAFCAGILYGLVKGLDQAGCMKFANAAAALSLSAATASDGLPRRRRIEAFARRTPCLNL